MKRWVVVVLVVLAVLVLISPGIVSRLTERGLEQGIEQAGIVSPEYTISTERFERGWFSSEGRHRIEFADRAFFSGLARFVDDAGYKGMPALIVDSHIDHGIVPVGSVSRDDTSLSPGIANLVATLQLDPGNGRLFDIPGDVISNVGITGASRSRLRLQKGNWIDRDVAVDWRGADLTFEVDSAGTLEGVSGQISPLSYVSELFRLDLEQIDLALQRNTEPYDVFTGGLRLQSQAVSIENDDDFKLGFAALDIDAASAVTDGTLHGSSRIDVSDAYWPGLDSIGIDLDLEYDGFDAAAFAKLYRAWKAAAASGDGVNALAGLYPTMETELAQFFAGGPQVKVAKLNIRLPQGELESDFALSLPKTGKQSAFSWPGLLLKLKATIKLRLSEEIYEMLVSLDPQLRQTVAFGFLLKDGDSYKMTIEYASGVATVNGAPMTVPLPGT